MLIRQRSCSHPCRNSSDLVCGMKRLSKKRDVFIFQDTLSKDYHCRIEDEAGTGNDILHTRSTTTRFTSIKISHIKWFSTSICQQYTCILIAQLVVKTHPVYSVTWYPEFLEWFIWYKQCIVPAVWETASIETNRYAES